MKKELYIGTITFVLVVALIYMPTGYAQNLTANVSNATGNASAAANQTGGNITEKIGGFVGNVTEKLKNLTK
jgi:hypothetical protein